MATLTITVPDNAQKKLTVFVKEIGGEIVVEENKPKTKKAKLLADIEAGLKDVKLIKEGKLEPFTMEDLLNGE